MIRFGFARENITPTRGIPLCGYFEPRPNKGAYDPLCVKAALFACGNEISGIVSFDLCLFDRALTKRFQEAVREAGMDFAGNLLFCATHTHTGPYVSPLFGGDDTVDKTYVESLIVKTVSAVKRAFANLSGAELLTGRSTCGNLAFNRRFWMKDGSVLTNPGKLNPNIIKPEGGIIPDIPMLAVRQEGRLVFLLVNISNHTDTIGGDVVSADWPGRMEQEIQHSVGYDLPVIMLTACQGNINHFNVENDVDQTNYGEACRIGRGYASAILSQLYALKPIAPAFIRAKSVEMEMPPTTVTDREYAEAKAIVEKFSGTKAATADDLTSEGIAKGNAYVQCFFARALMGCRDNPLKEKRIETLFSLQFGGELGIVGIPGEPFIEIQTAIQAASHYRLTMVGALCMGAIGYIGMPESYGRGGGYETRPCRTAPAHDLAPKIIDAANKLLNC